MKMSNLKKEIAYEGFFDGPLDTQTMTALQKIRNDYSKEDKFPYVLEVDVDSIGVDWRLLKIQYDERSPNKVSKREEEAILDSLTEEERELAGIE